MKEAILDFLKKAGKSLNPASYKGLCEYSLGSAFRYFLQIMLLGFVLYSLISLPWLLRIPGEVDSALSRFNRLEFNIDTDMSEPAYLFRHKMVIDANNTLEAMPANAGLYINSESLQYRHWLFGAYKLEGTHSVENMRDVLSNRKAINAFLTSFLLFAIPGLFIAGYVYFVIKALLLILAAMLLILILTQLVGFRIKTRDMLCICLYASIFLAINLIMKPIIFLYFIPIVLFLICCIVSTILCGDFKEPKKKDT